MRKVRVVINEQHSLLSDQERAIREKFGDVEIQRVNIPSKGLNKEEQAKLAKELAYREVVIFASPVPLLMALTVSLVSFGKGDGLHEFPTTDPGFAWRKFATVYVFHNDRREKKELPNGRVIMTVAQEGWELIPVAPLDKIMGDWEFSGVLE